MSVAVVIPEGAVAHAVGETLHLEAGTYELNLTSDGAFATISVPAVAVATHRQNALFSGSRVTQRDTTYRHSWYPHQAKPGRTVYIGGVPALMVEREPALA